MRSKAVFQASFNVFWSILIASNINLPNEDPMVQWNIEQHTLYAWAPRTFLITSSSLIDVYPLLSVSEIDKLPTLKSDH